MHLNDAPSTFLAPIPALVKNSTRNLFFFYVYVGSVFSQACHQYEVKSGVGGEMPLYGLTILTNCLVPPRA